MEDGMTRERNSRRVAARTDALLREANATEVLRCDPVEIVGYREWFRLIDQTAKTQRDALFPLDSGGH
jgi:hypothetical protein